MLGTQTGVISGETEVVSGFVVRVLGLMMNIYDLSQFNFGKFDCINDLIAV